MSKSVKILPLVVSSCPVHGIEVGFGPARTAETVYESHDAKSKVSSGVNSEAYRIGYDAIFGTQQERKSAN